MTFSRRTFWLAASTGLALLGTSRLDTDWFYSGRSLSSQGNDLYLPAKTGVSNQSSTTSSTTNYSEPPVTSTPASGQPAVNVNRDIDSLRLVSDLEYNGDRANPVQGNADHASLQTLVANTRPTGSIVSNDYTDIRLRNFTRKVAFIHVGKAGGNTVRSAYPRLRCSKVRKPTEEQLAQCHTRHWRDDSPLSQQCDLEIHMGPNRPQKNLGQYTTFLFAIRNPVARAISSYSYLHHNNTNSVYAQIKHYLKETFYKDCFPTLEHLLNALHNTTETRSQSRVSRRKVERFLEVSSPLENPRYCRNMAIAVLEGKSSLVKNINVHLKDNYQFYFRNTIQVYPHAEVLAVRTEHLWDDLRDLDRATGGSGDFSKAGFVANENVQSKQSRQDPTLEQLRDLCCILWEDIGTYQKIVNLAVNLPFRLKLQTMQNIWSTCSIDGNEKSRYQPEKGGNKSQLVQFSWFQWHEEKCPKFYFNL